MNGNLSSAQFGYLGPLDTSDKGIAFSAVREARAARLGEGHWADLDEKVRRGNARSHLALAAQYRRRAAGS